ncbi:SAM-dependent methyltransferase [Streptomyces sp. URMC 123]|uniref:SAM-dependent methyltransferase n=1 Tax=Streptomyces sp. URMC 123 TaxID=3423403 RepID=UPI003F1BC5F6
MTNDQAVPPALDTRVPHSARMYDYWLGGSSNFAADRALGQTFQEAIPNIRTMALENRRFLGRAVRLMAGAHGIRQFLDIGSGIPAPGDTPSVTGIVAPDSRIVCVDNDPIVQAHSQAYERERRAEAEAAALGARRAPTGGESTRAGGGRAPTGWDGAPTGGARERTVYLQGDLTRPEELLASPEVTGTLDLDRPVGLLLVAVLMLISDEDDPWGHVATLLDALPSGSMVAVTHPGRDFEPRAMARVVEAARRGHMTLVPRTRAEVGRFFGDWEPLPPGLVPVMSWRPENAPPPDPNAAYYWAGVARKA